MNGFFDTCSLLTLAPVEYLELLMLFLLQCLQCLGRITVLLVDKELDVFNLVLGVVDFSFQIFIDFLDIFLGLLLLADKLILLLS